MLHDISKPFIIHNDDIIYRAVRCAMGDVLNKEVLCLERIGVPRGLTCDSIYIITKS
jgi:hypothetical protein